MSTHYDTLEVSPKASPQTIRAAYRSLMQRFHPDKNPGNAQIAVQAAEVTRAYGVISDPDQRLLYDRQLANLAVAPAAPHENPVQQRRGAGSTRSDAALQKRSKPQELTNRRFLGWCLAVLLAITLGWWAKQRSVQIKQELQESAARSAAEKKSSAAAAPAVPVAPSATQVAAQGVIEIPEYIKLLRVPLLHTSHKTGSALVLDRIDLKVRTPDANVTSQLLRETLDVAQEQIADQIAYLSEQELRSIEGERLVNEAIAKGIRVALGKPLKDPGWVLTTGPGAGATASLSISTETAAAIAENVSIVVTSPNPYLIQ